MRRLSNNFDAIERYAVGVQSHTHTCTTPDGPCGISPPMNNPLAPLVPLRRSLVWNNATQAEHQQTVDFLRQSLASPDNSPVDDIVLALLLSDHNIRSTVVGPLLETFLHRLVEQGEEGDGLGHQGDHHLFILGQQQGGGQSAKYYFILLFLRPDNRREL